LLISLISSSPSKLSSRILAQFSSFVISALLSRRLLPAAPSSHFCSSFSRNQGRSSLSVNETFAFCSERNLTNWFYDLRDSRRLLSGSEVIDCHSLATVCQFFMFVLSLEPLNDSTPSKSRRPCN